MSACSVRAMTEADVPAWDAFVDKCPEATFFHRAGWKRVIEASFGHTPRHMLAERDGEIVGILPLVEVRSVLFGHALISNGWSVCGGPAVVCDMAREALDAAAERLLQTSGAAYLEYRCPRRLKETWQTRDDLYAGFSGALPADEDANLKQIPRKQRAVVRKAIESALTWRIDDTTDDFYRLYATSVRNLGTPVFSRAYFANLLSVFAPDCDVLTICDGDEPVASVINFYFKGSVLPFYTGSLPKARRSGANDLMYWRLMRHAVARGCTVFDFGRSKVGTGPFDFKKNWGFAPKPLAHQYLMRPGVPLPNVNPTNPKYRLMIAAWKRLPLWASMVLGPIVARNIG